MTERLKEVEARIAGMRQLHSLVGAMRGIAAARAQQARAALAGTRAYTEIVADALADAYGLVADGRTGAPPDGPAGLVVFGAEHGFAGAFSERVLAQSGRRAGPVFLVGSRGRLTAEEAGWQPAWSTPMASGIGAVPAVAGRIADEAYRRFSAGALGAVDMVFARLTASSRSEVVRVRLLPPDPQRLRRAAGPKPLTNLPPARLLEQLLGEYVLAELAHATMESFAAENAARLETMAAARGNIDDKLAALEATFRQVRQQDITSELIDLIAGTAMATQR
jgi:F-type H+-transporting ATPase subunit gamma